MAQKARFYSDRKSVWLSLTVSSFFLWLGVRQFRKMEKSFADLI
jgi:lipopolysaccharide transport system permease protein